MHAYEFVFIYLVWLIAWLKLKFSIYMFVHVSTEYVDKKWLTLRTQQANSDIVEI